MILRQEDKKELVKIAKFLQKCVGAYRSQFLHLKPIPTRF